MANVSEWRAYLQGTFLCVSEVRNASGGGCMLVRLINLQSALKVDGEDGASNKYEALQNTAPVQATLSGRKYSLR